MKMVEGKPVYLINRFINSKRTSLWIFLLGFVVFAFGYRPEFISSQTRFALFAKEMLRNGISFFPTTYGTPYPDYPGTSTILIYLISLIPGEVTPFTAILPTAIVSALILVFIYKTAALQNRYWGIYAVLLAFSTYDFFDKSRSVSLDQYTSLMTILCFYFAHASTTLGKKWYVYLIPLFFVIGFAFRGPIGLVIPAAVTGGYFLWRGDYKKVVITALASLALLALCIVVLLRAAHLQGGDSFVQQVIKIQWVRRVANENPNNYLYYWLKSFTYYSITYPIALFVLIYKFREIIKKKSDNYRFLGYLGIWVFIVLTGMSIPDAKHMYYILPVVPAFSLAAAYLFIDDTSQGKLFEIRKIALGFCYILPLIALCAGLGFITFSFYHAYRWHWFYVVTLIALVFLVIAARRIENKCVNHSHRNLMVLTVTAAAFVTLYVGIISPINYELESTSPFVEKTISLSEKYGGNIAFYKINRDGEAIKFMVNSKKPLSPKFMSDALQLLDGATDTCFIAKEEDFDGLPPIVSEQMHILCYGFIGHEKCVTFVPVLQD